MRLRALPLTNDRGCTWSLKRYFIIFYFSCSLTMSAAMATFFENLNKTFHIDPDKSVMMTPLTPSILAWIEVTLHLQTSQQVCSKQVNVKWFQLTDHVWQLPFTLLLTLLQHFSIKLLNTSAANFSTRDGYNWLGLLTLLIHTSRDTSLTVLNRDERNSRIWTGICHVFIWYKWWALPLVKSVSQLQSSRQLNQQS